MKPDSPLYHSKHIFRAGFLFFLGVVGLIILRSAMQPDTWGQYGPYRGASILDYAAMAPKHAGSSACADCHEDEAATHEEGGHRTVSCELCHGALGLHIQDEALVADMPVRRSAELCLDCHRALNARPASFPQIEPRKHVEENGEEFGPEVCFECHDPHSPF